MRLYWWKLRKTLPVVTLLYPLGLYRMILYGFHNVCYGITIVICVHNACVKYYGHTIYNHIHFNMCLSEQTRARHQYWKHESC